MKNETNTHKIVKRNGKYDLIQKGFEIADLKYNDEILCSYTHYDDAWMALQQSEEEVKSLRREFFEAVTN